MISSLSSWVSSGVRCSQFCVANAASPQTPAASWLSNQLRVRSIWRVSCADSAARAAVEATGSSEKSELV